MTPRKSPMRWLTLIAIAMFTVLNVRADGIAAFERGDYAAAKDALVARVAGDADDAEAHLYLARTLLALEQADAAAESVDRAVALRAGDADAHVLRGRVYGTLAANASLMAAGRYAKVTRKAFERALDIDPAHRGALVGMIQFKSQAPKLVGGSKREALAFADRLIAEDRVEGTLQKVAVLRRMQRRDDSDKLLGELLVARPDDPRVRLRLGFDHLFDDDYEPAIEHFAAAAAVAVTAAPDAWHEAIYGAWYQLGRSHVFANKQSDDAADALRRYIDQAPASGDLPGKDWANFRLGELLAINGQNAAAQTHFQIALDSTTDKDLRRRARDQLP